MTQKVRVLATTGAMPITVGNIKDALKITSPAPDPYLDDLPAAALDAIEQFTGRCIIRRTLGIFMDLHDVGHARDPWWTGMKQGAISALFRAPAIELDSPPLVSIDLVNTYDINDVETLFAASNYRASANDVMLKGKLILTYGSIWPPLMRAYDSIDVQVTAGWADGAIPPALKQAILNMAVWAYKTRAPCDASCCEAVLGGSLDYYRLMKVSA